MKTFLVCVSAMAVLAICCPAGTAVAQAVPGDYIVVLDDGVAEPNDVAKAHGLAMKGRYTEVFRGFSASIPVQALKGLKNNPHVRFIQQDMEVHAIAQTVPTGVSRIGAYSGYTGLAVDAGVAVIDTGIDLDHADLNVVVGADCRKLNAKTKDCLAGGDDDNGHGSHVAGIIGAKDNGVGVVGVAPGVRLYAVKVLSANGSGTTATVIQGIDWVMKKKKAGTYKIDVANMSLGGLGVDDTDGNPNGCAVTTDAQHLAICRLVAAGVTMVVAAGNEMDDAANHTPSAYDEVITVSSLADFDGLPGGLLDMTKSWSDCTESEDDSFTCFSNYGHDVDIMAPGVAIYSTYMNGGYASLSGTSMAAPHVAGAAAVLIAKSRPVVLLPQEVKAALLQAGDPAPCATLDGRCLDDPDGVQEPLVMLGVSCTDDADCDDGSYCTGVESCVAGTCFAGTAVSCNDGFSCTTDSCNEASDGCVFTPQHTACNDGKACTVDTCNPALGVAGTGCLFDAAAMQGKTCSDGNACTSGDVCNAGVCAGTAIPGCIVPVCGDKICSGLSFGETCKTCAGDCACLGKNCRNGCCGNGVCESGESKTGCPADCK